MAEKGITITVTAETARALEKLTGFFESVGEKARHLAELAGFGISIREVQKLGAEVLELGSRLNNLRARVGGSIPDLVILQRQLMENGGAAESAGQMLNFMQRAIVVAAEEGGAGAKLFQDLHLGVSLSGLSAMTATEQYRLLGAAIAGIENPAKRAEAVLKIFGRGGGELAAVFSDPKRFQAAFAGENVFGQVMARSAEVFHELEVNWRRFTYNGVRAMAGLLEEVTPEFQEFFETLGHVDLTRTGQRAGAFVEVVINAWRENKFPELLGLLIEAGFEAGINAVSGVWTEFWGALTGRSAGQLLAALGNGVVTFGVKSAQFLLKVFEEPVLALAGGFDWLYDQIRVGFQTVFGWVRDNVFTPAINFFIEAWNRSVGQVIGKTFSRVAPTGEAVEPGKTLDEAMAGMLAASPFKGVNDYLQQSLEKTRELMGFNEGLTAGDNRRGTALERLNALIEEQRKKTEGLAKVEKREEAVPIENRLAGLRETERLQKEKVLLLDRQLAEVENSFLLTSAQKWERKRRILEQQRDAYLEVEKALRRMAGLQDDVTAEKTLGQAQEFQHRGNEKDRAIGALGADPNSVREQMGKTMTELRDQFGTTAENIAGIFKRTIGGAIANISDGITGLIEGTTTWAGVLHSIAHTVLNAVITGIINMFAAWVTGTETKTAADLASQGATLPGKIIDAIATGISSYGLAVAGGAAAIALLAAWGAGAFEEGGYTGAGRSGDVAGVVHRGEYVFSAPAVRRVGVGRLEEMHRGEGRGERGERAGGARVNLAIFHDQNAIPGWTRTQEGESAIVDVVRKNWHRIV